MLRATYDRHLILRSLFWPFFIPLSYLWFFATQKKRYRRKEQIHSKAQIVSVGNIHAGGSGKTPITVALARFFEERSPLILTRGYKRKSQEAAKVDLDKPDAIERFGDEPVWMAKNVPVSVMVANRRWKWVEDSKAHLDGKLILLDDGFQHFRLHRDLDLVLVNTDRDPEFSFCLPYGDLREPWSALRKAHGVILISRTGPSNVMAWREFLGKNFPEIKVFTLQRKIDFVWKGIGAPLSRNETVAFCGIGFPQSFLQDLTGQGVRFKNTHLFADHHAYTPHDIEMLRESAEKSQCTLITTEKDWEKIQAIPSLENLPVWVARNAYEFPEELCYFLNESLKC